MEKEKYIPLVPLPKGKTFITNELTVDGLTESGLYQPNGKYFVKASSERSDKHKAYNAFNINTNTYWECDNVNNPEYNVLSTPYPEYKQSPYNKGSPSAYRGGGNKTNYWVTKVGSRKVDVPGEWLQIQLPYKIYLTSYLVMTPAFIQENIFPVNFMVVGSLDGESWELVNQHHLKGTQIPQNIPEKMFYLSPMKQFNYYRFIVTKMNNNIGTVKISNLKLFGSTMLFSNSGTAIKETFVNLNRDMNTKRTNVATSSVMPHNENIFSSLYSNMFGSKEPFENEYKHKEEYEKEYNETPCNKDKANMVIEKQVDPLTKTAHSQEQHMKEIASNYKAIENDLEKHSSLWSNETKDNVYNSNDKIKNKDEVRNDDSRKLVDSTNQTLFLGGIATLTLIIGIVMVKNNE